MRKFAKFVLVSALVLFVGVPLAVVAFVFLMAALGVAIGIGGALLGLVLSVLKFAIMVILPIALVWWLVSKLCAREKAW